MEGDWVDAYLENKSGKEVKKTAAIDLDAGEEKIIVLGNARLSLQKIFSFLVAIGIYIIKLWKTKK